MSEELEPLLEADQIQGNILVGFNKDHQAVLTFSLPDEGALRQWVAGIKGSVTWLAELEVARRQRREQRARGAMAVADARVHVALGLSSAGLSRLLSGAATFGGRAFRQGMDVARSSLLGDPHEKTRRGEPTRWLVGGGGPRPDGLLILASDDPEQLAVRREEEVRRLTSLGAHVHTDDVGHDPSYFNSGSTVWPSGIEHFGFKDGVGRPGIRGRIATTGAPSFLTPRMMPEPDDISEIAYATPGRPLVAPGEFVLGYAGQNAALPGVPLEPDPNCPSWALNGSFLVFRRLAQDVPLFNRFLATETERLRATGGEWAGLTTERLGALLVGRWRSGAPVSRFPEADPRGPAPSVESDDAFLFGEPLAPADGFPASPGDLQGLVCPFSAHIRKVNPRDTHTDQGTPPNTLKHRLLRRGIPYGRPLPVGDTRPDDGDRGLLFLAYMASIEAQFEFIQVQWTNDPRNPAEHDGGYDMIMGQAPCRRLAGASRACEASPPKSRRMPWRPRTGCSPQGVATSSPPHGTHSIGSRLRALWRGVRTARAPLSPPCAARGGALPASRRHEARTRRRPPSVPALCRLPAERPSCAAVRQGSPPCRARGGQGGPAPFEPLSEAP